MVFIEELSVAHNHKLTDQFQQLQQKVESDATRAINLTIQANHSQSMIINELRKRLDNFQLYFERLERVLQQIDVKIDSLACEKPRQHLWMDEGIPIEKYLSRFPPISDGIASCQNNMLAECSDGIDLWSTDEEIGIRAEIESFMKGDRATTEEKGYSSDSTNIEPWMTISRKQKKNLV